jgi:hypothetical protein
LVGHDFYKEWFEKGDALTPLLFNLDLDYAIKKVEVNQVGMKLNGIYLYLVHVDNVNILGESVQTIKKKKRSHNTKHVHVPLSQYKTCTRTTVTIQNMYTYHCHNTKHVHVRLGRATSRARVKGRV